MVKVIKAENLKAGDANERVELIKKHYLDACDGNVMDTLHSVCEALFIKDMYMEIVLGHSQKKRIELEPKFAETYFKAAYGEK